MTDFSNWSDAQVNAKLWDIRAREERALIRYRQVLREKEELLEEQLRREVLSLMTVAPFVD